VRDGRYYALGASDTKGGIAAVLDAAQRSGPTQGVAYLFYADEEYNFLGMQHFLRTHDSVRPAHALSVCGPPARLLPGYRGVIELELVIRGRSGHASRPHSGRSATFALHHLVESLSTWCANLDTPHPTTLNLASVHAGSLIDDTPIARRGPPALKATANRLPDAAWALLEFRTGASWIGEAQIRERIQHALNELNRDARWPVEVPFLDVHFALPGYASAHADIQPFVTAFDALHQGQFTEPGQAGYVDIAMLAARHPMGAVCLGPLGGNEHAPDEWVDLASVCAYRDGVLKLLAAYQATDAR
jgi:acetylornithine deacetylase/succinyl-diaminopimelate desuccinylase-like protein